MEELMKSFLRMVIWQSKVLYILAFILAGGNAALFGVFARVTMDNFSWVNILITTLILACTILWGHMTYVTSENKKKYKKELDNLLNDN